MPLTATSGTVWWSRGRSRRPTWAAKPSCRTTTGAQSPVRSVVRGSTTRTSATTSNALGEAQDGELHWQGQWQGQRRQGQWQGHVQGQWQRPRWQRRRWTRRFDRKPDKDKNADQSRGNPDTTPGGNSEPSGGKSNTGPTDRPQMQAEQEQGTKCANEDGEQSNACKRSRFVCMARKLQKKGFEATSSAEC